MWRRARRFGAGRDANRQAADVLALQANLSTGDRPDVAAAADRRTTATDRAQHGRSRGVPAVPEGAEPPEQVDRPGIEKALDYFQQAIDEDPVYALVYAWVRPMPSTRVSFFSIAPPTVAMPKAKAAAAKALQIDDRLAEAHLSLVYA